MSAMTAHKKSEVSILCITSHEDVPTPRMIDGVACRITTQSLSTAGNLVAQLMGMRPRLSTYDYILTFNFWSTYLVAQVLAQGDLSAHAPLHIYGCMARPDECDVAWGHHAIRGVRRLGTDIYPLFAKLRARYPYVRHLIVPYDRPLFTQIPEWIPDCFTPTFTRAARMYGFEVEYLGVCEGVEPRASWWKPSQEGEQSTALMMTFANTGIEQHREQLEKLCTQFRASLFQHHCVADDGGATPDLVSTGSSIIEHMTELIKRHQNGEALKKIENITLPACKVSGVDRFALFRTER